MPDAFDPAVRASLLGRVEALTPSSPALWGKMNVAQMLAHCCILYDQIEGRHDGGPWIARLFARLLAREAILGERPFRKNLPTPKAAHVDDSRDFEREKGRLTSLIRVIHGRPRASFEGHPNPIFGPIPAKAWSNLLYKHLDHHLRQFGV